MSEVKALVKTVIEGGYCIGCGACTVVDRSPLTIKPDDYGRFQAALDPAAPQDGARVLNVCPFSDKSADEDAIGRELFGTHGTYHGRIGFYFKTYAGFVAEGDFRAAGSSGGMGTWIVHELLRRGMVDGVIHVRERHVAASNQDMFGFDVSFAAEDVRQGAKSRYYPVEMSRVLDFVKKNPGRYALVGIPCFVKAVRLLARRDPVFKERIVFCIGLVCGHLKSSRFAEMFAWQCGIAPDKLEAVDFRKKIAGQRADRYGVEVTGVKDGKAATFVKTNNEFYGHNWGHGFLKYEACDYCDDVLAETADVAVGDAWLPQYTGDDQGTNVVVVRNKAIAAIIEEAVAGGRLKLEFLSPDDVARSQDAGLRHRREGLAYRLFLKDKEKSWRPPKRVAPDERHLDRRTKKIQVLRMKMAALSHQAFASARRQNSFQVFKDRMGPLLKDYQSCYKESLMARSKRRLKNVVKRLTGRPASS